MAYLIDTSVLCRLANISDAFNPMATRAIVELHRRHETLYIAPQNLVEFRSAATRPATANGLELSPTEAQIKAAAFESAFTLLPETPEIYPSWKALVSAAGVIGRQVHDARLVAICHLHRVTHVLTFNVAHFARLSSHSPGIVVVDSATI